MLASPSASSSDLRQRHRKPFPSLCATRIQKSDTSQIYDQDDAPALTKCLGHLLDNGGDCFALISITVRNLDTFQAFAASCTEQGLCMEDMSLDAPSDDEDMVGGCSPAEKDVRLLRVRLD